MTDVLSLFDEPVAHLTPLPTSATTATLVQESVPVPAAASEEEPTFALVPEYSLPPARTTFNDITFSSHDVRGNVAALIFARLIKNAGLASRITTGGKLDFAKLRRAANALNRGVASDRPQPTTEDWESATRFLQLPSDPVFANSYTKRGDAVPEEAAEKIEAMPVDEGAPSPSSVPVKTKHSRKKGETNA